jgi:hypothetical protein
MGRQEGVLQITGQVGSLTFFKSKKGFLVRTKGGISSDRIRTDPAFVRTRENGLEFGRATKSGRLLRTAFRTHLLNNADSDMTGRMSREIMKVVKADTSNPRGARKVVGANAVMLQGFEFNEVARLGSSLYTPYATAIDRPSGALNVVVEEFIPRDMVVPPAGATHAQLVAAAAAISFDEATYDNASTQSETFALDGQLRPQTTLSLQLPANSAQPIFLVFGIAFFQDVNGSFYPLKNGAFNALALVKIDGGV